MITCPLVWDLKEGSFDSLLLSHFLSLSQSGMFFSSRWGQGLVRVIPAMTGPAADVQGTGRVPEGVGMWRADIHAGLLCSAPCSGGGLVVGEERRFVNSVAGPSWS